MANRVKGMNDYLADDVRKFNRVTDIIREEMLNFGASEIITPLLEYSEVFHREKELSDMVKKETYDFLDRGERKITIRPEGTAGIARAYIENKLYSSNDLVSLFYFGTYYRYERPQKNRYREFRQFGIECFGSDSYLLDVAVISLIERIYKKCGLDNIMIRINTIGDIESRQTFSNKMREYFEGYKAELCEDCLERLNNNPLRILDCKVCNSKAFFKSSPTPLDYVSQASKERFEKVIESLDGMGISYKVDKKLVRGLDYYSETVFEIDVVNDLDYSIKTLGGGGRYDNLISDLGGPNTKAFGFAGGIERLINSLEEGGVKIIDPLQLDMYIVYSSDVNITYPLSVYKELLDSGYKVSMSLTPKSFKSQLKKGISSGTKYLIFIGKDEEEKKTIEVKETSTEKQQTINRKDLLSFIGKV